MLAAVLFCVGRDIIPIFHLKTKITDPNATSSILGYRNFSDDEKAAILGRKTPDKALAEFQTAPGPVTRSAYIFALVEKNDPATGELEKALEEAVAAEPDNAVYFLMLSKVVAERAVDREANGDIKIKDRALFDRAMNIYLTGAEKSAMHTYIEERNAAGGELVKPDGTFTGWLMWFSHRIQLKLPHFSQLRAAVNNAKAYTGILLSENDPRAEIFINSFPKVARLVAEDDTSTLIGQLVAQRINDTPASLSAELEAAGYKNAAEEMQRRRNAHEDILRNWKQNDEQRKIIVEKGGILSELLLWGVIPVDDERQFLPERRFSGAAVANFILLFEELLIFAVIVAMALYLVFRHRGIYLMILPGKKYLQLALFGVVIPLVLWQILDFVLCRTVRFPVATVVNILAMTVMTSWFIILAVKMLKKRHLQLNGVKIGRPILTANMIVLLTGMMALQTMLMRPWLEAVRKTAMAEDTLIFHGKLITPAEDEAAMRLRSQLLDEFNRQIANPVKLQ